MMGTPMDSSAANQELSGTEQNPLLTSGQQLQRFTNLSQTSAEDFQELEVIKQQLKTFSLPQPLQALEQVISRLVWKLEAVLKEKNDLILADNMRASIASTSPKSAPPASSVKQNRPSTAQSMIFETDEEDTVEEEGEWTTHTNKKKRKGTNQRTRKINSRIQEPQEKKPNQEGAQRKPPPIKVETTDVKSLTTLAKESAGDGFVIKPLNDKILKVNLENSDDYRKMVSSLKEKEISFHTYENKQTRPIRVVAKGLHHQWTEAEIFCELQTLGYKIINVSRKLSNKDKSPLNMVVLSFGREENIESIYKINRILHNVVEICPIKGDRLVPQCKRCQDFGHTKNHCNITPRCVKCAQNHLTINCEKQPNTRAKCANCNGDHPANYRGCSVAKEAQAMRKQQRKAAREASQPARSKTAPAKKPQNKNSVKAGNPPKTSWAQVVRGNNAPPPKPSSQGSDQTLSLILNEIRGLKSEITSLATRVEAIEQRSKPGRKPKARS
ncbi:hypothetical protein M8J77_011563 [Diaphorina citri]|nr:hypothetical protein M8J77_011563 [Diaphorina citri]